MSMTNDQLRDVMKSSADVLRKLASYNAQLEEEVRALRHKEHAIKVASVLRSKGLAIEGVTTQDGLTAKLASMSATEIAQIEKAASLHVSQDALGVLDLPSGSSHASSSSTSSAPLRPPSPFERLLRGDY